MRSALAGVALFATLALLAAGDTGSQDKDKKDDGPARPAAKAQLPRHFDMLGLTDAQRAEVLGLVADHQEKRAKLQEEIRKLDEEAARKRVAVLTDEQRKKLIDLLAGPDPKAKADPQSKGKAK